MYLLCFTGIVRVGFPSRLHLHSNHEPFWKTNNETGQLSGYYIDFIEAVFEEIGRNFTFVLPEQAKSYNDLGL